MCATQTFTQSRTQITYTHIGRTYQNEQTNEEETGNFFVFRLQQTEEHFVEFLGFFHFHLLNLHFLCVSTATIFTRYFYATIKFNRLHIAFSNCFVFRFLLIYEYKIHNLLWICCGKIKISWENMKEWHFLCLFVALDGLVTCARNDWILFFAPREREKEKERTGHMIRI